jgi:hypothetical protein
MASVLRPFVDVSLFFVFPSNVCRAFSPKSTSRLRSFVPPTPAVPAPQLLLHSKVVVVSLRQLPCIYTLDRQTMIRLSLLLALCLSAATAFQASLPRSSPVLSKVRLSDDSDGRSDVESSRQRRHRASSTPCAPLIFYLIFLYIRCWCRRGPAPPPEPPRPGT